MKSVPRDLRNIVDFLQKLPGIGPKTAKRLGFYMLRLPNNELIGFADSVRQLKNSTKFCKQCFNLTENENCMICDDQSRDQSIIAIVEDVLDLLAFEQGQVFNGLYHVLHGRIDPLNYIGPEDIFINPLLERIKNNKSKIKEIIIATNPDTEGEATAMYIQQLISEKFTNGLSINITRLAYGLPIGADLEYTDYLTLKRALEGRKTL